jgi:hypothetical protein
MNFPPTHSLFLRDFLGGKINNSVIARSPKGRRGNLRIFQARSEFEIPTDIHGSTILKNNVPYPGGTHFFH